MAKKTLLFLLVVSAVGIHGSAVDAESAQQENRRVVHQFGVMYQKFLQQVNDNKQAHAQARELCETAGNCDECPLFQELDAKKEMYAEKVNLIEDANRLHARLCASGIENGFDRQRTIRKIINGW